VDVIMSTAKRTFTAHTSMTWQEFKDEVSMRLGDDTPKPIQLAYKICGDVGRMSVLNNVVDWDSALTRVCTKVKTVRRRPVSLDVKNTVSSYDLLTRLLANPGLAKAKPPKASNAKEKRRREDDIPPPMSSEMEAQMRAFKQLETALNCEAHRGHCVVDHSGGRDNHRRLSHGDMSLWAKQIVSDYFMRKFTWYSPSVVNWQGDGLQPPAQPQL